MARMQTYDEPTHNWAARQDYQEDYRDGERICHRYESSLTDLEKQALEIYKKTTGQETITQAQLTAICQSCNRIVASYQEDEECFKQSAEWNGYVEAVKVDPNNPYLEASDVKRRDAAYTQMREAVYGVTEVQNEDGSMSFPMVDVNIPAPAQKPSEQ